MERPERPSLLLPRIDAMDAGVITFLCAVWWRRRAALCCGLSSAKLLPSRLSRSQAGEAGGAGMRQVRASPPGSLPSLTHEVVFQANALKLNPREDAKANCGESSPAQFSIPTAAGMQGAGMNASSQRLGLFSALLSSIPGGERLSPGIFSVVKQSKNSAMTRRGEVRKL